MRYSILLASSFLVTPALAADVTFEEPLAPAPMAIEAPASGWSGLYIGLQGGGAFSSDDPDFSSITYNNLPAASVATLDTAFFGVNGAADSSFDSSFIGGAHIGYDYQFDNVVLGGVLDINALDIAASTNRRSSTPADYTIERSIDYLGTGRIRAGYLVTPTALAYVTGGFAYADIDYRFFTDTPAVTGTARAGASARAAIVSEDEDDFGYTIGGGMEVKVTDNISFGAEYLYTSFGEGDSSVTLDGGPFDGNGAGFTPGQSTTFRTNDDFDFHTVTAKLSYRFN